MGRLRYIFLFIISILIHVSCFSQIKDNEIEDSINSYISEGLFVKASNRFVDYALYLESIGEKEECDAWFERYVSFIDGLDISVYKNEIIRYYLNSLLSH